MWKLPALNNSNEDRLGISDPQTLKNTLYESGKSELEKWLTLFQLGSGVTLLPGGGALCARISSKFYKTTKKLLSTQNLFPYKYFDL